VATPNTKLTTAIYWVICGEGQAVDGEESIKTLMNTRSIID